MDSGESDNAPSSNRTDDSSRATDARDDLAYALHEEHATAKECVSAAATQNSARFNRAFSRLAQAVQEVEREISQRVGRR
jgi:hypothetical protein